MANISYVNGLYCNIQEAKININDRGYHFGDAVYEVILYNDGIFYDYDGHIKRLFNSLKLINIKFHLTDHQLKIIIKYNLINSIAKMITSIIYMNFSVLNITMHSIYIRYICH